MARRRKRRRSTKRRNISTQSVIVTLLILFGLYLYQSGILQDLLDQWGVPITLSPGDAPAAGPAIVGDGEIQAFFTTPHLIYPDRENQRRPPPVLTALIEDIEAAQTSIDMAIFDLDIPEVTQALVAAQERGVRVRVVLDSESLDTPEVSEQTGQLEAAGAGLGFDEREPFMHHKFVVIDGAVTWGGSWNLTVNGTYRNNNNMVRFNNPEIATTYTDEFQQMFDGAYGVHKSNVASYPRVQIGETQVQMHFSPTDETENHIIEQLQQAESSIRFMAFSYTLDSVADVMLEKMQSGVTVQGVFEKRNASGTGSEFERLRGDGDQILVDGNCYVMHHKVIIIDERVVLTGSYNFSASAENSNDENLITLIDPTLVAAYMDEFERVYEQAQTPLRCG